MKTVGIIGGIAPESTIQYYRLIIDLYRKRFADGSYPNILINSIDMKTMLDLIGSNDLDGVTRYLLREIDRIAKAGADFAVLASNTPHLVFDGIQKRSPVPLISIVEATYAATEKLGLKKVGLFGTRFTMNSGFYPDVFSRRGMTIIVPEKEDQDVIHWKYMGELVNGIYLPDTREKLMAIAGRLRKEKHIEGLILGGTELPLLLNDAAEKGFPFLDTTRIHAESIVETMLER